MVNPLIFFFLFGIQAVLKQVEIKKQATFAQEGCCNIQSVTYSDNQQRLYIPNVFTPNGDGFNDRFVPRSDNQDLIIRDFMILSAYDDSLVFFRLRIDYSDRRSLINGAWNGLRKDGSPYQGRFRYRLTVGNQAVSNLRLEGEACALRCRGGGRVLQTKEGCFYAD